MNLPANVLLSDEFAEFSGKVTALHEKKKEATTEFKKLYEKHKADMKGLDEEAENLQNEFDKWAEDTTPSKAKSKEKTKDSRPAWPNRK